MKRSAPGTSCCSVTSTPSMSVSQARGRSTRAGYAPTTSLCFTPLFETGGHMATMRAVQVPEAGADFELVEREIPTPGRGQALVRVEACGVCHSDMFAKEGAYPGVSFPVVPGHEVAGTVAALGDGVKGWEDGQRVGVGWYGGNCGQCGPCRAGNLIGCQDMGIPGITFDG